MSKTEGIYSLKTHSKKEIEKKLDSIYSQLRPPIKLVNKQKIDLQSNNWISVPVPEDTIELK